MVKIESPAGDGKMEKTVKESMIEQVYAVRPQHLNSAGRLFGGKLMEWIDETASLAAVRHAGHYLSLIHI